MAVRDEYKFTIAAPYARIQADDQEITADETLGKKWDKGYKIFKGNIRTYLRNAQNGRCAFCRCWVSIGTSWSNLEHIVSKTDYNQFAFFPINLVYSCTRCNMAKRKENSLANPLADKSLQHYPVTTNEFLIINPYYDNYEAHIDFIDELLVTNVNNSIKGEKTIEFYNLTRSELAEERARDLRLERQSVNKQLLDRLIEPNTSNEIIIQIHQIIQNIPNWQL